MEPYVTSETIGILTPLWLEKIAPINQHRMQLRRDQAVLLVIDMQDFFLDPASPTFTCGGLAILPHTQAAHRGLSGGEPSGDFHASRSSPR